MGRYYSGNIEGKFWFGVQSSEDGEFFGMWGSPPTVTYYGDDLDAAKIGLDKCEEVLGENLERLKAFFDNHNSYNDEMIHKEWEEKYDEEINIKETLVWFARHRLGSEIVKAIEEDGYCSYEAEI